MLLQAPATLLLVCLNVVIFLSTAADQPGDWTPRFLVGWGGNLGRLTLDGEPWRLVSALFLHGGFGHLAGNMMCLLVWGSLTELALGTGRFLLAYFACGILANLASAAAHPAVVSVGASGAIAGILGLMVVIWWKGDARVSPQGVLANLALNAFMSLLPGVDGVAHVAGFFAGLAIGPLLFTSSMVLSVPDNPEPPLEELGPVRSPSTPVSFQEPMDFPKGTVIYRTRSRLVAILPDWTLIADDGARGALFETARDYRDKVGDDGDWTWIRQI